MDKADVIKLYDHIVDGEAEASPRFNFLTPLITTRSSNANPQDIARPEHADKGKKRADANDDDDGQGQGDVEEEIFFPSSPASPSADSPAPRRTSRRSKIFVYVPPLTICKLRSLNVLTCT